jgi:hypothetical protein
VAATRARSASLPGLIQGANPRAFCLGTGTTRHSSGGLGVCISPSRDKKQHNLNRRKTHLGSFAQARIFLVSFHCAFAVRFADGWLPSFPRPCVRSASRWAREGLLRVPFSFSSAWHVVGFKRPPGPNKQPLLAAQPFFFSLFVHLVLNFSRVLARRWLRSRARWVRWRNRRNRP